MQLGSIITECTESGVVALAFDDGPYSYTSDILDVLEEYDIAATFFVTGNNLGKGQIDDSSLAWPDLLQRMYSAGHHVASHTWTHRELDVVNSTIQRTEMVYNEMAFRNLFGWFPTYMRPPYLECSSSTGCLDLMEDLGYHVITCNLDTKDYENDSPDLIQTSKDKFSAGLSDSPSDNSYIILAHDVHEQTVKNLTAYMITTTQDRGYKLVTVGACLGDPEENWYRSAGGAAATTTTKVGASSTNTGLPLETAVPFMGTEAGDTVLKDAADTVTAQATAMTMETTHFETKSNASGAFVTTLGRIKSIFGPVVPKATQTAMKTMVETAKVVVRLAIEPRYDRISYEVLQALS
ncbi:hypothetical protein QQZ08_002074 [Neonectria magnoliae]|uniref:NodB homology domain-containing protein n=1 Tax=Neonectria magnoliae TaxID=2732573 RepID=A0ABR1ICM9_9HYPO